MRIMLKLYLDKLLFTAFKVITVFTVILMALLYLYNWDLFHTSDYAMIGLMALKQIETGIHEIYVWSVGYNGILLEVKLIEFFFRLYGANE